MSARLFPGCHWAAGMSVVRMWIAGCHALMTLFGAVILRCVSRVLWVTRRAVSRRACVSSATRADSPTSRNRSAIGVSSCVVSFGEKHLFHEHSLFCVQTVCGACDAGRFQNLEGQNYCLVSVRSEVRVSAPSAAIASSNFSDSHVITRFLRDCWLCQITPAGQFSPNGSATGTPCPPNKVRQHAPPPILAPILICPQFSGVSE